MRQYYRGDRIAVEIGSSVVLQQRLETIGGNMNLFEWEYPVVTMRYSLL